MRNIEGNTKAYWNQRYQVNTSCEASGYLGLSEEYNKLMYKAKKRTLNRVFDILNLSFENKRLLDIGCGLGLWVDYWKDKKIADYTGVDVSEVSMENFKKKYPYYNYVLGDIRNDGFPKLFKDKFDIVTAFEVFLIIHDKMKLNNGLNNVVKSLKENGYLLILESILSSNNVSDVKSEFHTLSKYKQILANYNMRFLGVYPIFFLMLDPVNADVIRNPLLKKSVSILWNRFSSRVIRSRKFKNVGIVYSLLLFLIDSILARFVKEGLSMKVAVFQLK